MKWFLSISIVVILNAHAFAQDLHFSQFFAAPLLVNPANTGSFTGAWRIGLNYRDQWGSVTIPYRTYDVYTDGAIQPKGAKNRLGIGAYVANDVAGDGELTTTKAIASAAYQISLAEDNSYKLSVGISGGIVQKRFDLNKLVFDSQWDGYGFDNTLPNMENGVADKLDYLDFSVGGMITASPYARERYYLGIAAHHITQPDESFYGNENTIGVRTTVTTGAFFPLNNSMSLNPQLYYSEQKHAREIILGTNASFPLGDKNAEGIKTFIAGIWYRYADAAWLMMGVSLANFTFSASYDFNFSGLTPASNTFGGLELALVYTLAQGNKKDPLNCPAYE